MTCKDFSGLVPAFLEDRLDNETLRKFLNHLDSCKGCREELEIQYLVIKVFDQTDAGGEVNLSRDLPAYIEKERKLLTKRNRLAMVAALFEGTAIIAVIITGILFII